MKKIIFSVLTVLFSMCMIMPLMSYADDEYDPQNDPNRGEGFSAQDAWCYADDNRYIINDMQEKINSIESGNNEKLEKIQESVDGIDVKKDVSDVIEEKAKTNSDEISKCPTSFVEAMIEGLKDCWAAIPYVMGISTDSDASEKLAKWEWTFKPRTYYYRSPFYNIFQTIGYSLVLVFFAANLIENTIKYEIFTLKGGAQLFGRLIISKVIIDMSGKVCVYILNICDNISSKILKSASDLLIFSDTTNITNESTGKFGSIIGGIIDYLQGYTLLIPVIIILLIMLFAALVILFKLVLRSIELSLLMIVSPAFFACYSSEITKPYFKNFIMTFLQCALQIVYMSVVYALSSNWIKNVTFVKDTAQAWTWSLTMLPKVLIVLAIAIMMVKPPKVLTTLVK